MEPTGNIQAHFPEANGHLHQIISFPLTVPDDVFCRHTHEVRTDQACSVMVQSIKASIDIVWSIVCRFDNPQVYMSFLNSCRLITGDGRVGTVREVEVISGQPATYSIERLEVLDNENHVISFRVLGGDHRLDNYQSVMTLHETTDGNETVVVESYVVDVPQGNSREETCFFANNFVRFNLQSLTYVTENLYGRSRAEGPRT